MSGLPYSRAQECYQQVVYVPFRQREDVSYGENGKSLWRRARKYCPGALPENSASRSCQSYLFAFVPFFFWISKYDVKHNLFRDIISGLTVGTLAVPQALGYAIVAGVAPIFGLYTSFIPPLIYTLFGTSRHVSVGTFSLVALMCGETVMDVTEKRRTMLVAVNGVNVSSNASSMPGAVTASEVASILAVTVGGWQVLLGLLGMGTLTVFLSDRVIKAFACGAAVHIVCSQLKWIFGISLPKRRGLFNLFYTLYDIALMLPDVHLATLLVSGICFTVLIVAKCLNGNARVMKVIRFPIPMELLVIIFGSLSSYLVKLRTTYGVDTVKHIPLGLPQAQVPPFYLIPEILLDGFLIAVMAFSIAISAARVFSQKHGYSLDGNQEFRALGMANLFSGFFQCFPSGVALARSAVQESSGGRTQIVSILMGLVVGLVISFFGPLLEPIPNACLGCINVVALGPNVIGVTDVARLWRISKTEAAMFLVPYISIIVLDVEVGLAIGVVFSLLATVIYQSQKAQVEPLKAAHRNYDCSTLDVGEENIRIIRMKGPLYFANAESCLQRMKGQAWPKTVEIHSDSSLAERNRLVNEKPALVLDMVSVTFIDISGVDTLKKLHNECLKRKMPLYVCDVSESVRKMLLRCDFVVESSTGKPTFGGGQIPVEYLRDSVFDAVNAAKLYVKPDAIE